MDPRELTALVTGVANALYCRLETEELVVLAAVLTQLGDTLATLAAQKDLLEAQCARCEAAREPRRVPPSAGGCDLAKK